MSSKKSFKNIGAQAVDKFFSAQEPQLEALPLPSAQDAAPEPKIEAAAPKKPIRTKELKSRRVPVLMSPTLYDSISKIAHIKRASVNEIICQALRQYADDNASTLKKYEEFVGL